MTFFVLPDAIKEEMINAQFSLVYLGHLTWNDTELLTLVELKRLNKLLKEVKDAEARAQKEALSKH